MRATVVFSVALASVAVFAILLSSSDVFEKYNVATGARRLQGAQGADEHLKIHWGPKHTAALIFSVLVSLTSSLDRECGASLYAVLFAVVLNMSFRKAAAMTAFTVALGALGPGIASMSEARLTERGVLPVVDYPGALVLLPTLYWGVSFGAIVNLVFPNWLLALLWVMKMTASNLELLVSFVAYLRVTMEAAGIARRLRFLSPPVSSDGTALGTTQQRHQAAGAGMTLSEMQHQRGELLMQAQHIAKRARRIEARALLYPTLYVADVGKALQKADIDINPCSLRATATPSCLGAMDFEQERLASELRSYQQVFGRFTFSWRKWWTLNRVHFELSMVLKIVVMHLATEAIRHHLSKPCTKRFWIMLCGMTGLVTAVLLYTVSCYTRRRLWRGPHWVDALNQVRQIKKQEQMKELQALQAWAGKDIAPVSLAFATGDTVAVDLSSSSNSSHDGAAIVPDTATGDSMHQVQNGQEESQPGCWPRFRSNLPWVGVKATEALSNISNCNSYNSYKHWRLPLMLTCAAVGLPIGVLGCALGLPGGPLMAQLLLLLGLKPAVVAGTSRFLVLCFMFGSFVAHIISGGLEPSLAAAFGLLNLGLAPLGMFLVTKVQPRGVYVIGLSLVMGVAGAVVVAVWQLVPLMADLITQHNVSSVSMPVGYAQATAASLMSAGNRFSMNRFCHSLHHEH